MNETDTQILGSGGALRIASARPLDRPLIFVTGAPRSGTSLVTKVLDSHPGAMILMENIFANRRRHWMRPAFWDDATALRGEVTQTFARFTEPVVGNKVCTPDVWSADDICRFCTLFADFRIVFVVRDPVRVALSRLRREDYDSEFTPTARRMMLLDFRTRCRTYTSSWRQSIESYWKLRDGHPDRVRILYYEEFCDDFLGQLTDLCTFSGLAYHDDLMAWYEKPHHDACGSLVRDLKYPDRPVARPRTPAGALSGKGPGDGPDRAWAGLSPAAREELEEALATIGPYRDLWSRRLI